MKKSTSVFLFLLSSLVAAFAVSCTDPTEKEERFLRLSDVALTFPGEGGGHKVITVKSNPGWSVKGEAQWLELTDQTETTITVSAAANDGEARSAVITVIAGELTEEITVNQLGAETGGTRYRLLAGMTNSMISPSGRYAGGFFTDALGEDSYQFKPVIVDLQTDEWTEFGPYPENLFSFHQTEVMTDQGILYISESTNGGCVGFNLAGGDYFRPESVAGCGPTVMQGSSADGSVMVGYVEGCSDGNIWGPVKYVDGVAQLLPLPEKNFRGEDWWAGVLARGCSADGSIIYGTTWENYDYGMVYWDKDGEVHYVGEDVRELVETVTIDDGHGEPYEYSYYNGIISDSQQNLISPSGEWIAGTYRVEKRGEDGATVNSYCPAFYNTVTRTTTLLKDYPGCGVNGVTDDGLGFVNNGYQLVTSGRVVDLKTGTDLGSTVSWMEENYGIVVPEGLLEYVTPDGKIVFGAKPVTVADKLAYDYWYVVAAR